VKGACPSQAKGEKEVSQTWRKRGKKIALIYCPDEGGSRNL
jgi:hypothetical protein